MLVHVRIYTTCIKHLHACSLLCRSSSRDTVTSTGLAAHRSNVPSLLILVAPTHLTGGS